MKGGAHEREGRLKALGLGREVMWARWDSDFVIESLLRKILCTEISGAEASRSG